MTHSVAAIARATTTGETQRTQAPRSTGTSFAQLRAAAAKTTHAKDSSSASSGDTSTSASAPKGERKIGRAHV